MGAVALISCLMKGISGLERPLFSTSAGMARASSPGVAIASPGATGGSSSGVAIAIIIPPERHRLGSQRIFTTWGRCHALHTLPATGINTTSAMGSTNLRRLHTKWLMLRCTRTPSKRDYMACCNCTCSLWNYKYTGTTVVQRMQRQNLTAQAEKHWYVCRYVRFPVSHKHW